MSRSVFDRFGKLTYVQKKSLIIVTFFAILFLSYSISFRKTIDQFTKYKAAQKRQNQQLFSPAGTGDTHAIQQLYSSYLLDTILGSQQVLQQISKISAKYPVSLVDYQSAEHTIDSISLLTHTIKIEGNFISCLEAINDIENHYKKSRITLIDFLKITSSKEKKLQCTIRIQNIINHER